MTDREKLIEAQAEIERLRKALSDIAGGLAPPEVFCFLETDTRDQFRGRMWAWSEERARAALSPKEEKP